MDNNFPKCDIEVADNGMKLIQSFKNFKIKKKIGEDQWFA